jgi:hypothetical protein
MAAGEQSNSFAISKTLIPRIKRRTATGVLFVDVLIDLYLTISFVSG